MAIQEIQEIWKMMLHHLEASRPKSDRKNSPDSPSIIYISTVSIHLIPPL
jgi:hypothetical protein